MFMDSYRKNAHSLWSVLFRIEGNILCAVLPFCIANCMILGLVAYYRTLKDFGFSPTGHGLLTLLVSFLVISKVNLAYDRFRAVRKHAADVFLHLRELMQMVIAISTSNSPPKKDNRKDDNDDDSEDRSKEIRYWRLECLGKVTDLMNTTVTVVKDPDLARYFARNTPLPKHAWRDDQGPLDLNCLDPLAHVQSLRMHVYCTDDLGIHLLERVNMVTKLQEFVDAYNNLLILASTPLPFPLVQMGRAFLFLWTFSMPLVLLEGPFSEVWGAQIFLFFLTYGFIGLELVSIKLSDPFGDSRDDVQLDGIRDAALLGMENDLKGMAIQMTLSERRLQFSQQKYQAQQQARRDSYIYGGKVADLDYKDPNATHGLERSYPYHVMDGESHNHDLGY
jgi:predicted membrane chloride channel (bestrophin family)